ncbi:MAG: hypothetical protein VX589_16455, partial [Myxococcota bacterium]|nr:hypothetical protein [Myxococcota bacterium]
MDEIVLRDLIESDPGDEGAAEALVQILTRGQRWDDLVQFFLERIEGRPTANPILYHRLAETLETQLGRPGEALIVLLDGLKAPEDDDILGDDIGRISEALGEWENAIAAYRSLLGVAGNHQALHRRLADWYAAVGDVEASMRHRRSLYDEDPADVVNLRRLQDYLHDSGDWSELERLLLHRFDTAHPS